MIPLASRLRPLGMLLAILAAEACGHRQPAAPRRRSSKRRSLRWERSIPRNSWPASSLPTKTSRSRLADRAGRFGASRKATASSQARSSQLDTADLQAQLQSDLATANSNHATTTHDVYQGSLTIRRARHAPDRERGCRPSPAYAHARSSAAHSRIDLFRQGYVSQEAVGSTKQPRAHRRKRHQLRGRRGGVGEVDDASQRLAECGQGLEQSTIQQSRAQEQVAAAQADQVRVQIAKATIVSPIDGVVVNRNLNPGEYPGTRQIFTLQQVDPVYAVLHGSGAQVAQIRNRRASPAIIAPISASQRLSRHGRRRAQPDQSRIDRLSRSRCCLENPRATLRPGMAVSATIALPPMRGIRVPETAFTDDNHDAVMTVQADGTRKDDQGHRDRHATEPPRWSAAFLPARAL